MRLPTKPYADLLLPLNRWRRRGPYLHWSKTQVDRLDYVGSGLSYRGIDYCHAIHTVSRLKRYSGWTDQRQFDRQIVG